MSVRSKKKRRLVFLLVGALGLAGLGAGAYFVRMAQIENRAVKSRDDGLIALRAGDHFTALHKVGTFLQRHPDEPQALYAYAQAREEVAEPENKHLSQAMRLYARLLDLQPDNVEARHKLLDLYLRTGYSTESLSTANELLRVDKTDAVAIRAKAIASARLGKPDDALRFAREYNKLKPVDFDGHILTFELLRKRGDKGVREILALAKALSEAHPDDPRFELLQSIAFSSAGDKENAELWALQASNPTPNDAGLVLTLARQLDTLNLFGKSLTLLEDADVQARKTPGSSTAPSETAGRKGDNGAELRRVLVARWWQLKLHAKVADFLKDLDPAAKTSDSELLAFRAISLIEAGRRDEAKPIIDALAARQGQGDAAAAAWTAVIPVVFAEQKPEPRRAIEACQQALAHAKGNPYITYYLGDAYARLNEGELAMEQWMLAFQAAPAWADPLIRYSRVALALRQPLQARPAAQFARLRAPDDVEPIALEAVAWAGSMTGPEDVEKVLELIESVQKKSPGEEQTLPIKIALLSRYRTVEKAKEALSEAVNADKAPSEAALLRLAALSRELKLGLENECVDRAEKTYGLTHGVAFSRSMLLQDAGQGDQALVAFEVAKSKHEAKNPRAWKLASAQLMERGGNEKAREAWVALADELPADVEVQQMALAARSVQSDRAFVDRTVGRLKELSGGQGAIWRLARSQSLLRAPITDKNASEAMELLNEVVKISPRNVGARLLLADAHTHLGNEKGAAEQLSAALGVDPSLTRASLALARMSQENADEQAAGRYIDRALESKSLSLDERRQAALVLQKLGQSPRARDVLLAGYGDSGEQPADLVLASLYRDCNQPELADAVYTQVLEKSPDVRAIQEAAAFYVSQNRRDDAERVLARLDKIQVKPGEKEMARGGHYLRVGDAQKALAEFEAAANALPGDAASWQRFAATALAAGKFDKALVAARKFRELTPNEPLPADQLIAAALLASGENAGAVEQLRPHIAKATSAPDDNQQLITLYSQAHIASGNPEEAAKVLRPLLAKSTPWRGIWLRFASQNITDPQQAGRWLDEAAKAGGRKAIEDDIVLAQAWQVLAQRTKLPEHAQATAKLLKSLSERANTEERVPADRLLAVAMLQESAGDRAAAEDTYRRVLQLAPKASAALNNLAMLIVNRKGDLAEAEKFAGQAVELNPKFPGFLDTLASVQVERKDFPSAIANSRKAAELEPANVKWHIYLGAVLMQAGQVEEAKKVLGEIEGMPFDVERLSTQARERLDALRTGLKGTQARS